MNRFARPPLSLPLRLDENANSPQEANQPDANRIIMTTTTMMMMMTIGARTMHDGDGDRVGKNYCFWRLGRKTLHSGVIIKTKL